MIHVPREVVVIGCRAYLGHLDGHVSPAFQEDMAQRLADHPEGGVRAAIHAAIEAWEQQRESNSEGWDLR